MLVSSRLSHPFISIQCCSALHTSNALEFALALPQCVPKSLGAVFTLYTMFCILFSEFLCSHFKACLYEAKHINFVCLKVMGSYL